MGINRRNRSLFLTVLTATALLAVFIIPACSGGGGTGGVDLTPADGFDAAQAQLEISQAESPSGLETELWDRLTTELAKAVAQRGTAAAPAAGTRVEDLAVEVDRSGIPEFTWTYRNAGDYDLNGMVNVSDLTPVGRYFNAKEGDPNWPQAMFADGNGNGLIEVADITPIGQHFNTFITDYALMWSGEEGEAAQWEEVAAMERGELSIPDAGGFPEFSMTLDTRPEDGWFCLEPRRYEGQETYTLSTAIRLLTNVWNQPGQDYQNHCSSPFTGPGEPQVRWSLGLPVIETDRSMPLAIGPQGDIYMVCACSMYAVSPSGVLQWEYNDPGEAFLNDPVVMPNGSIHLASSEALVELDPDGTVVYQAPSPFYREPEYFPKVTATRFGPDGNYYGMLEEETFGSASRSGNVRWEFTVEDWRDAEVCFGVDCLFMSIYYWPGGGSEEIRCYDYSGVLRWSYEMADGLVPGFLMADENNKVYANAFWSFENKPYIMMRIAVDTSGELIWETEDRIYIPLRPAMSMNSADELICSRLNCSNERVSAGGDILCSTPYPCRIRLYSHGETIGSVLTASDAVCNTYTVFAGSASSSAAGSSAWVISADADGNQRWTLRFPGYESHRSNVVIDADGVLYFVLGNGTLYAVGNGTSNIPDAPAQVQASNGTLAEGIEVEWTGTAGAEEYYIYRDDSTLPVGATSETIWLDTGVVDHETYTYRVATVSSQGRSELSMPASGHASSNSGSAGAGEWACVNGGSEQTRSVSYPGPQNGAIKFVTQLAETGNPSAVVFGSDGTGYCTVENYLYSIDAGGSVIWKMCIPCSKITAPVIDSEGVLYMMARNVIDDESHYPMQVNKLLAISSNRELQWEYEWHSVYQVIAPVVTPDGTVLADNYQDGLYAFSPTGELLWSYPGAQCPAVGPDGKIYAFWHEVDSSKIHRLIALNTIGGLVWEVTGSTDSARPVIGPDGTIYWFNHFRDSSSNCKLTSLTAVTTMGSVLWEHELEGYVSMPAVSAHGDLIFFSSSNTENIMRLLSFDTVTRSESWVYDCGDYSISESAPVVDGDGSVYAMVAPDCTIAALDSAGNSLWTVTPPDSAFSEFTSMSVSPDGELYCSCLEGGLAVVE